MLSLAGGLLLAYSYFIEPQRLVINSVDLKVLKLNPALDGLRIVAISDIHGGSNGSDAEKLRKVVRLANAQDADLIVLLGDYVAQQWQLGPREKRPIRMPIGEVAENLRGLKARYGVYGVLGNHDGWHDDKAIKAALESVGIDILENEIVVVEKNGYRFRILGLEDHLKLDSWFTFDAKIRGVVAANERAGDIIVLEHSPDIFDILNYHKTLGNDFRLMLAGHTHGGQVWLPILGRPVVPSSYGQKYAAGHVRENSRDMFVTTGVGTSILPFRFMVPPEIAVVTLKPE